MGPAGTAAAGPVRIRIFESNTLAFVGAILQPDGTFRLDAIGPANGSLRLDAATSLSPTALWTPLATNTSGSSFFTFTLSDPATYPQRFYRITPLP